MNIVKKNCVNALLTSNGSGNTGFHVLLVGANN